MAQQTFTDFWDGLSTQERTVIRESCKAQGMKMNQLYLVARGERPAGIHTVAKLMQADARITLQMMRPDLFKTA